MDLELINIEPKNALAVFTSPDAIDPFLKQVREEIDAFSGDISTAKGRADIKSMAHKVTKVKTRLEAIGKTLADEQKEIPKKIDATRKRIRDTLEKWSDEVRQPVTDWEAAEKARVERHEAAVGRLDHLAGIAHLPLASAELEAALAEANAVEVGPTCEEYEAAYAKAKDAAITALTDGIAARKKHEAEQAELAELRRQQEERQRKERDEQIAREAAERAVIAEQERQQAERDAAARREQELQQKAEEANRRAAEAEREALRQVEAQRAAEEAEAKRRQADKEHRTNINRAALAALVDGGIPEQMAKEVLILIATNRVPHVCIEY